MNGSEGLEDVPNPTRQRPEAPDILGLLKGRGIEDEDGWLTSAIDGICRLGADKASRGDVKILTRAVREMRYTFRVFANYRTRPKVTVFGSARTPRHHPAYSAGVEFGRRMAQGGWMVITGAGDGIMRAGHDGAGADNSFGLAIRLPFEQAANSVIEGDSKLIVFRHFFTRKLFFVKEAKALCMLPGGFGTHDELFESLTLIQTGKTTPTPIVLLDEPGGTYWQAWRQFVQDHLANRGYISQDDFSLFQITDSVEQAVQTVLGFYRRYHSSRYVGDLWVARLQQSLDQAALERLNASFSDILLGPAHMAQAMEEEADEPEIASLPRLVAPFNRRSFGRLRQLIDAINELS